MKKAFVALLLLLNLGVFADAWLPTASIVPVGTSSGVNSDVNMVYDAADQIIVAAWGDRNSPNIPYYAIYDGTAWITAGTPIPIGTSAGVRTDVNLTYNAQNQTVVASWSDSSTRLPFYAVFDGSTWITAGTAIPPGTSTGVDNTFSCNVTVTYNAANQTVMAAWTDNTNVPYYAVFDGSTWTTAGTPIPLGAAPSSNYDIALTYNAANQTVVAAWAADSPVTLPYYAVFDGSSWITPGTVINFGTSLGVYVNVRLAYDAANQTVIAAWADSFGNNIPYYSVFNGTSWFMNGTIPLGAGTGVKSDVNLSFNSVSGTVFAAWAPNGTDALQYSIFDGSTWITSEELPYLPTTGGWNNVGLAFHTASRQMVAAWRQAFEDGFPANPFYNIYLTSFPPPLPPEALSESSCCARFATQKVAVTTLAWDPSPSEGVTAYNIYRDGTFVAQVDASTFEYRDAGACSGGNVYGVTSVSIHGESLPITVTVPVSRDCR